MNVCLVIASGFFLIEKDEEGHDQQRADERRPVGKDGHEIATVADDGTRQRLTRSTAVSTTSTMKTSRISGTTPGRSNPAIRRRPGWRCDRE